MPLYFAYGENMDVEAMARRCPRSKPRSVARLMRHRLAIVGEGWPTATRDADANVDGVLWDVAQADSIAGVLGAARRWSLPAAAIARLERFAAEAGVAAPSGGVGAPAPKRVRPRFATPLDRA